MKGYLDRIVDDKFAVILVDETGEEFLISKEDLPRESKEKSYYNLEVCGGKVVSISLDKKASKNEKKETKDLMDRIRANSKGSKFNRM
jgi:hypothetical protein